MKNISPLQAKFQILTAGVLLISINLLAQMIDRNFPQAPPQNWGSLRIMPDTTLNLTQWFIQSSAKLQVGGEVLSTPGINIDRWYPAQVPSTVLGTLVDDNIYEDVYFGKNLENIKEDDFKVSWWYRTEFLLTAYPGKTFAHLELDGVNYRANIWLNGQKVADASQIYGPFRRFDLDITQLARIGEKNVLAIEVIPPVKGEPTIGFVDWNPAPPDHSMGLWRPVKIKLTGEVSIKNPFVQTQLDPTLKEARLIISAELQNNSNKPVLGSLEAEVENIRISQEIKLGPKETQKVLFAPDKYQELILKNPRIWWTYDLGKPELYLLILSFKNKMGGENPTEKLKEKPQAVEKTQKEKKQEKEKDQMKMPPQFKAWGLVSDWAMVRFGIREIKDYLNEEGYRGYLLNGKKILIRGGGWTDDLFLNNRTKKVRNEILYARHMNLNALRLEGFWGTSDELYDLCDEQGILLMVGWSCQWEWENLLGKATDPTFGGILSPEDISLVAQSFHDQVLWLRNHPSIFVWALASDLVPKPELENEYHKILAADDPTRPFLNSTGTKVSPVSGKSGVKMNGPYDWVPPNYWYEDKKYGGAFGFNTETGPGPQVPVLESLKKMIPEEALWPPNDYWDYHCCRGIFRNLDRYNEAMKERLGWPKDVTGYCREAQYLNYEAMRAMFEAFIVRRYQATGIIQWMYNSAWPKLWWQLYDYFLMPTGAFYGARKACQPVHLIYDYETKEIIASNLSSEKTEKLKATIRIFDLGFKEKYHSEFPLELEPDSKIVLTKLPPIADLTPDYFLDLRISGLKGELKDQNLYCLSTTPDLLDFDKTTWFVTPVKKYADFKALNNLPRTEIKYHWKVEGSGNITKISIELDNPSAVLAFNLEIQVLKKLRQKSILPIFLEDNYISLWPQEKRIIKGYFFTDDLEGDEVEVRVRGWNVQAIEGK